MRHGLCRLISALRLVGSTVREFSIRSVLWVLRFCVIYIDILIQFLSNRSQHVIVEGCRNKQVNVVSGVAHGSVLGLSLFQDTSELFSILENKLIGYADDPILIAGVPSPVVRVTVAARVPQP